MRSTRKVAAALAQERERREGSAIKTVPEQAAFVVLEQMERQYDGRNGGFGFSTKFPHPEALDLLIASFSQTRDPFWQEMASRTLDGMAERGMYDRVAGGFFRYSTDRAWQTPHFEKMSDANAALIRTYLHAAMVFGVPKYGGVAQRCAPLCARHARGPGGRHPGQPGRGRGVLPARRRRARRAGRARRGPAHLHELVGPHGLLPAARQRRARRRPAAGRIPRRRTEDDRPPPRGGAGRRTAGMFHLLAPDGTRGEKGLLADQAWMAQAALDAYAHTGDAEYREQARRIAAFMLRTLLAPTGFRDRPLDDAAPGLLAEPVYNLAENGVAAELFLRLLWLTGEETYKEIAGRILAGFGETYAAQGAFAAGYALAWVRGAYRAAPRRDRRAAG